MPFVVCAIIYSSYYALSAQHRKDSLKALLLKCRAAIVSVHAVPAYIQCQAFTAVGQNDHQNSP